MNLVCMAGSGVAPVTFPANTSWTDGKLQASMDSQILSQINVNSTTTEAVHIKTQLFFRKKWNGFNPVR